MLLIIQVQSAPLLTDPNREKKREEKKRLKSLQKTSTENIASGRRSSVPSLDHIRRVDYQRRHSTIIIPRLDPTVSSDNTDPTSVPKFDLSFTPLPRPPPKRRLTVHITSGSLLVPTFHDDHSSHSLKEIREASSIDSSENLEQDEI